MEKLKRKYISPSCEIVSCGGQPMCFTSGGVQTHDGTTEEVIPSGSGDPEGPGESTHPAAKGLNGGVKDWDHFTSTWE